MPRPSSVGSGRLGGATSSSSTISASLACIRGQSSTASRLSRSTRWRRASIDASSASSVTRSISMCIHDSCTVSRPPWSSWPVLSWSLVSAWLPSSPPRTLRSSPATSRTTSKSGWMTTWTVRPSSARAIVAESTRKGMSSVTTSTTVCAAADHPWSGTVGVNTRTRAVPCGRVSASLKWLASAPYRSISLRTTTSSGATWRKYAVSSPPAASPGGPPVPRERAARSDAFASRSALLSSSVEVTA